MAAHNSDAGAPSAREELREVPPAGKIRLDLPDLNRRKPEFGFGAAIDCQHRTVKESICI
jgi:hypothetical protein